MNIFSYVTPLPPVNAGGFFVPFSRCQDTSYDIICI